MSKAEDYIVENMKSGLITGWDDKNRPICQSWLTPDQAKEAVELEREEVIEKVCEYIASNMRCDGYTLQTKSKFIKDLKQAMKDE